MILVDKDIKELVNKKLLIINGYNEKNVQCASYDLVLDKVIVDSSQENSEQELDVYTIEPGEFIYIKMKEKIHIPNNIMGRVAEKNGVMRRGLMVSGCHYMPGHKSNIFIRLYNISQSEIKIERGEALAQIIFERLTKEPKVPYSKNQEASFNEEEHYKGFGKYTKYNKNIKQVDTLKNKVDALNKVLDEKESKIYSNILTFMGIFVSIFSIISINFQVFNNIYQSSIELIKHMFIINISLAIILALLFMMIHLFIHNSDKLKNKSKINTILICICLVLSISSIVLVLISDSKEKVSNIKTISTNDMQSIVVNLQKLLYESGYDVRINGEMDKATEKAIEIYIKEHKLQEDMSIVKLMEYIKNENTTINNDE